MSNKLSQLFRSKQKYFRKFNKPINSRSLSTLKFLIFNYSYEHFFFLYIFSFTHYFQNKFYELKNDKF